MKGNILILMMILFFSLGSLVANVHAGEPISKTFKNYEISKLLWSNAESPEGVYLGRVTNFVVDSSGRIEFAILLEGYLEVGDSYRVAVPFDALSLGLRGDYFVLNTSRERLASAPRFNEKKDLFNRAFAENVYKYFGLQPYWTEGQYAGSAALYRWGGEAQGF